MNRGLPVGRMATSRVFVNGLDPPPNEVAASPAVNKLGVSPSEALSAQPVAGFLLEGILYIRNQHECIR